MGPMLACDMVAGGEAAFFEIDLTSDVSPKRFTREVGSDSGDSAVEAADFEMAISMISLFEG